MSITLSHYSEHDTLVTRSVEQCTDPHGRRDKPRGLWVSVDGPDDWAQWCESNEFGNLDHRFVVTLADGANILYITSPAQMREFTAEFRIADRYASLGVTLSAVLEDGNINWTAVAQRWQGIIITPYMRSYGWGGEPESPFWYWGWDCASGCIWDADAIASVTLAAMGRTDG